MQDLLNKYLIYLVVETIKKNDHTVPLPINIAKLKFSVLPDDHYRYKSDRPVLRKIAVNQ